MPVDGFDPDTTLYQVRVRHPYRDVVTATPRDPYATVTVAEAGPAGPGGGGSSAGQPGRSVAKALERTFRVTVESDDGSESREYQVPLVRR